MRLLDELRGLPTAVEMSLDPLTQSNVAALVSMMLPPGAPELNSQWLHHRTGGIPFYLRAYLDRWAASSDEMGPDLREVPDSVLHFVRRQLARLDKSVFELVRVAAIAGPQVGYRLLTRCCSDPETVLDQIDAAKRARVLTEASPGVLSFVHALVRQSVLFSLSTKDRVEMHLKVAPLLEEEDSSSRGSVAIAQHYYAAIPVVGMEPFIHRAILAARSSAETLSFEDAIEVAELALNFPLGNLDEAELRLQRGRARLALRDIDGGVEDPRRVIGIFRDLGSPASISCPLFSPSSSILTDSILNSRVYFFRLSAIALPSLCSTRPLDSMSRKWGTFQFSMKSAPPKSACASPHRCSRGSAALIS